MCLQRMQTPLFNSVCVCVSVYECMCVCKAVENFALFAVVAPTQPAPAAGGADTVALHAAGGAAPP